MKSQYCRNIGFTGEIFAMKCQCWKNIVFTEEMFAMECQYCRGSDSIENNSSDMPKLQKY